MKDSDPYGNFRIVHTPDNRYDFILQIGSSSDKSIKADFSIDGDGWLAKTQKGSLVNGYKHLSLNPSGPAVAACFGVAQVFKTAIGQDAKDLLGNIEFSTLNFSAREQINPNNFGPDMPDIIDIGNSQLVGVGSVGSAFLYFIKMIQCTGTITLIDHDIVKIINLNRSPIFGISNWNHPKVVVGSHYLNESGLIIIPFNGTYDLYIKQHGRKRNDIDILFPLANEEGVRWSIQNNIPPLMIYGTTTRDWGINFGRHIPLIEDCIMCRYPDEKKDIQYICSGGTIPNKSIKKNIDAALPFLSPLAAALMLSEIVKIQYLNDYPFNENFAYMDLKSNSLKAIKYAKKSKDSCNCLTSSQEIYKCFNELTKFAGLTSRVSPNCMVRNS